MSAAALVTALLALQGAPAGFSAEDLAATTARTATTRHVAGLRERAAQTDTIRAAFVLDVPSGWSILSDDEREALHEAFGADRPLGAAEIAWFMRSANVRTSGADLSGLYNPLADVWLVLRWARVGGHLRLADAALVSGETLRPRAEAGRWIDAGGLYGAALAEADALAAARFLALPQVVSADQLFNALAGDRAMLRAEALARLDQWVASLAPWNVEPVRRGAWLSVRERLIEGGAAAGAAGALPSVVRASMAPAAAIRRADGVSLLLVSPLYPALYVTADYPDEAGTGTARLAILNLANARPPGSPGGADQ